MRWKSENPTQGERESFNEIEKRVFELFHRKGGADYIGHTLLALTGAKPVTRLEFSLSKQKGKKDTYDITLQKFDSLAHELRELGLETATVINDAKTWGCIVIGKERENVDRFVSLEEKGEQLTREEFEDWSILLGYPSTAVKAFISGHPDYGGTQSLMHPRMEWPKKDFMAICPFLLSREHMEEELELVKLWAKDVQEQYPNLYQFLVREYRKMMHY